jgi:hypothetical protein
LLLLLLLGFELGSGAVNSGSTEVAIDGCCRPRHSASLELLSFNNASAAYSWRSPEQLFACATLLVEIFLVLRTSFLVHSAKLLIAIKSANLVLVQCDAVALEGQTERGAVCHAPRDFREPRCSHWRASRPPAAMGSLKGSLLAQNRLKVGFAVAARAFGLEIPGFGELG